MSASVGAVMPNAFEALSSSIVIVELAAATGNWLEEPELQLARVMEAREGNSMLLSDCFSLFFLIACVILS